MPKLLAILVDGLPHWKVSRELTPFIHSMHHGPMIPGIGFSVNLYPELLAGRQADDIGFFNKWSLRHPDRVVEPPLKTKAVARALDLSRFSFGFSRAIHKVFERFGNTGPIGNVPFRFLPYFKLNPGYAIFGDAPYPSIFDEGEWELIIGSKIKKRPGHRDEIVTQRAKAAMRSKKHIFAALTDTDAVSHARGMEDQFDIVGFAKGVDVSLDEHLAKVDRWCRELTTAFEREHGSEAVTVIFSDHGMAQVDPDGAIKLDLEKEFGPASRSTYLYMLEAVMLRLWAWEDGLEERLRSMLEARDDGFVLTEEQRVECGVTNREFGHIVFLLHTGKMFFPNFFGGRYPKAMHGYPPEHPSQHGVVACSNDRLDLPGRNLDLYPWLLDLVRKEASAHAAE